MRKNKYHARKVTVDGITFDSRKEADRWRELQLLERAGKITELKRQVKFTLIPTQRKFCNEIGKDGRFKNGEVLERPVAYIADFAYWQDGKYIVEDTKGVKTPEYVIKRKLMLFLEGIRIQEV